MTVRASSMRLAVASALLALSGVLTVAASAQRWWPACPIGGFDGGDCPEMQDHAYDYVVPSDPWVPVGAAAEVHGVAMMLLAGAVMLLPRVLSGRRLGRGPAITAVVVSVCIAAMALHTLLSGLEGEAVTAPGLWVPGLVWVFGWPALMVASAACAVRAPSPVEVGRWAVVGCLLVANPFAQVVVAPVLLGYSSYDTTPWAEAVGGVVLICAAGLLWRAAYRDASPRGGGADDSAPQGVPDVATSQNSDRLAHLACGVIFIT